MSMPDWEAFGRSLLTEWPVGDIDGADLFEAAERHGLIIEIPGGYDPDNHIDAEGICPERGDPWYEYNFSGDRSLFDRAIKAAVEAEREACAKLAANHPTSNLKVRMAERKIAAAIRSRGESNNG